MSDPGYGQSTPQFGTAEYSAIPGNDRCRMCEQPIGATYYRINDGMVCPSCAEKTLRERSGDSHAAFVRGLTAGIGAAIVGLIGYALVAIILQGWVISFMSFAVGMLIGTAMMKASKGVGGPRYQVAAVLLTYAAVSMAAVPIGLYMAYQDRPKQTQITEREKLAAEQRQLEAENGQSPREPEPQRAPVRTRPNVGLLIGRLALFGLASPFYQLRSEPGWGAMGLIILFVGMRIAWRIAAGRQFAVNGPFANSPPTRP